MRSSPTVEVAPRDSRTLRIGSVSFLNAKPLIYGLQEDADLSLKLAVPSQLLAGLEQAKFDVALLPVIDYQRLDGLTLVPAGGIGSDGPTLTVRIFSRKPIAEIRSMACDTDSHTSVALARVILAERYGIEPIFSELGKDDERKDAKLLIGDKVVCDEPEGFEHQLDLGQAWKELTGLPFVFAIWTARADVDLRDLPDRLAMARRQGMRHVDQIVREHAVVRGWPPELATQYLTVNLKFEIGPRQLEAIGRFHDLCGRHGLIATPIKSQRLYRPPTIDLGK